MKRELPKPIHPSRCLCNGGELFTNLFIESGKPCRIVNTGSEHSMGVPHTGAGIYTASKHALRGFSLALAEELRPEGVRVHVVCPRRRW